jgi:hypothetical protein
MQKTLNLRVKYRESLRPFAPAVLRECVSDRCDQDADSPYMLLVADMKRERRLRMSNREEALFGIDKLNVPCSDIPAVTHVDYSARVQTVHTETNPRFRALIAPIKAKTGCPVLVNTSFNVRSEPIVCSPEDAFRCFMGNEIEVLVVENCMLRKSEQDPTLKANYHDDLPGLTAAVFIFRLGSPDGAPQPMPFLSLVERAQLTGLGRVVASRIAPRHRHHDHAVGRRSTSARRRCASSSESRSDARELAAQCRPLPRSSMMLSICLLELKDAESPPLPSRSRRRA